MALRKIFKPQDLHDIPLVKSLNACAVSSSVGLAAAVSGAITPDTRHLYFGISAALFGGAFVSSTQLGLILVSPRIRHHLGEREGSFSTLYFVLSIALWATLGQLVGALLLLGYALGGEVPAAGWLFIALVATSSVASLALYVGCEATLPDVPPPKPDPVSKPDAPGPTGAPTQDVAAAEKQQGAPPSPSKAA